MRDGGGIQGGAGLRGRRLSLELAQGCGSDQPSERTIAHYGTIVVPPVRIHPVVRIEHVSLRAELDDEGGAARELLRIPEDRDAHHVNREKISRRCEHHALANSVTGYLNAKGCGQCLVRPGEVGPDGQAEVADLLVAGDSHAIHEVHVLSALIVEVRRVGRVLRHECGPHKATTDVANDSSLGVPQPQWFAQAARVTVWEVAGDDDDVDAQRRP